jgi:hypothetical protein
MPQDQFQGRNIGRPRPVCARLACAAGGVALAALIVCTSGAARAGDDDVSASPSIYDKFMETIGIGGGPNIQYGERSPLVVPPTKDLPPPQADAPPPVPNWPQDPDIARRKQAKQKEKPKPHGDYVLESSRPMRPDELRGSGAPSGGGGGATASAGSEAPRSKKGFLDFSFFHKEEYATFTGEPARTSLTDPPAGYMTPSPDQPYGIGPDQKKYKVPTVADRATVDSGSVGSSGGN